MTLGTSCPVTADIGGEQLTTTDAERRSWTTPETQDAAQRTYTSIMAALARSAALNQ